jgi:hypothetical protein
MACTQYSVPTDCFSELLEVEEDVRAVGFPYSCRIPMKAARYRSQCCKSQQYISLCLQNTLYSGILICESHQEVTNYQVFKHGRPAWKTNCESYSQYNCEQILHIYELRQIKGEGSETKWSCWDIRILCNKKCSLVTSKALLLVTTSIPSSYKNS